MLKILIPATKVVLVTESHSGYNSGICQVCDERGWIDNHGYPHGTQAPANHLTHARDCSMNRHLNPDGTLKAA